jgi:hypothetical protein
MKTSAALTSIYSFNASLPSSASAAMATLMAGQGITGTGAFGVGETQDAGVLTTLPLYRSIAVGASPTTVCLSGANGTYNKAGNWLAFRFTPPAAGIRTITVSSTRVGADPDFLVYQNGTRLITALSPPAAAEVASAAMSTAEAVLVVNDDQLQDGGSACLTVRVQ